MSGRSKSEERERRQVKVFTKRDIKIELGNLTKAMADGVSLIHLFEIIGDVKLKRWIKKPKSMVQKTSNLSLVLSEVNKFVKEQKIGLQYSPTQVAKEDERSILGMIWILITKFVIPESEESLSRKRSLLRWVQRVTEPYENVKVKNFTKSWMDGLAFNALLHQFDNGLFDYGSLDASDPTKNCNHAFECASKLGIYSLLDAEDVIENPDEVCVCFFLTFVKKKSVMTYVATMYTFFHSQAGNKLQKDLEAFKVDSEKLLKWIDQAIENWKPYDDLEKALGDFCTEKAEHANFKCNLYLKLASIQRMQRNERLKRGGEGLGKIHDNWLKLNEQIMKYSAAFRQNKNDVEERLRQEHEALLKSREEAEKDSRELEKSRLHKEIDAREAEEAARVTEVRRLRDEDLKQKEKEAEEGREAERKRLDEEIQRRENEEKKRRDEERRMRDEDLKEKEYEAASRRELEKTRLDKEIKFRDGDESFRREEERKRREKIIKEKIQAMQGSREEERGKKESEINDTLAQEKEKTSLNRQKKDEDAEALIEKQKKEREVVREAKEKENAERREKEIVERADKRQKIDVEINKKVKEDSTKRDEVRSAKEAEIRKREDDARTTRQKFRDMANMTKKMKDKKQRTTLADYDKAAGEFLGWLMNEQSKLTHVQELKEDEEDLSTDEATRNRRKEVAVEAPQKLAPILEKWAVLEEMKICEWASIPKQELCWAVDTALYALIGEEKGTLKSIRQFKFPGE